MKKSSTLINLFKQLPLTAAEIVAFAFFCFLFPLGQLGRLTLFNGGALYAHEAAMLLWITLTAHELLPVFFSQVSRITQEKFLYHNKLEIAFLVWASIGIVYAYLRSFDLVSILYLSRLIFYCYFAWTIAQKFASNRTLLKYSLAAIGMWYWWLAVVLYCIFPDMRFLWSYGWDQHYYRMIGTLFDPAFTGILSILTWLVLFSLKKKLPQWLLWTTSTGLLLAVLLTYSRASYLSAAVLALLIIGYKIARESIISRNRLLIIVVLVSSVLGFLIAPKPGGEGVNLLRTETIYARLNTARAALKAMSGTEWLVGNGLFSESIFSSSDTQTTTATHARMPDNIFITLLTQTGIIGLLLACGIAIRAISSLMRTDAELAFAWIVVLVHSQFNNSLLQPFVLLYLLLFMMSYGFKVTTRSILDSLPA